MNHWPHRVFGELLATATRRGDGQAPSKQMRMTLMRAFWLVSDAARGREAHVYRYGQAHGRGQEA